MGRFQTGPGGARRAGERQIQVPSSAADTTSTVSLSTTTLARRGLVSMHTFRRDLLVTGPLSPNRCGPALPTMPQAGGVVPDSAALRSEAHSGMRPVLFDPVVLMGTLR